MNRKQAVLAVLAASNGAYHSPVQVQKLFFLVDRNIPKNVGGPHFSFQPYNYGPFDKSVYETLEVLETDGLVECASVKTWTEYKLTEKGQAEGEKLLSGLPKDVQKYIRQLSDFVRSLSFTQLVTAIYKAYPDMKTNSVFQE